VVVHIHDMDDRAAVLTANVAFYRAFESLDLARMEGVWLQNACITCAHPGWHLLVGWGPVMASWQRIFANSEVMRFTITEAHADVVGDLAWVVCTENLESSHGTETVIARLQATNVFQRSGGRWWLVHHHASTVSGPPSTGAPDSMH